jgi:hypothetical protein
MCTANSSIIFAEIIHITFCKLTIVILLQGDYSHERRRLRFPSINPTQLGKLWPQLFRIYLVLYGTGQLFMSHKYRKWVLSLESSLLVAAPMF